jgi:hypothetical protein
MSEKRETPEGADGAVLHGPCDRAKAALLEPQSPGVEPHTHRHSARWRCCRDRPVQLSRAVPSAWQPIGSEPMQGDA